MTSKRPQGPLFEKCRFCRTELKGFTKRTAVCHKCWRRMNRKRLNHSGFMPYEIVVDDED